ncbi:MAG: MBL fold metallo-hydrolase [Vicinamibacterales bacterium]
MSTLPNAQIRDDHLRAWSGHRLSIVRTIILALAFAVAGSVASLTQASRSAQTLDIYFIDVEGGQSTLIVTPAGQTLLIDAGFPGSGGFSARAGDPAKARDAQRILAVTKQAGVARINYLLATHFHADHAGGVPELSQLIPIEAFIDHGGVTEDADRAVPGTIAVHQAYAAVREGKRHLEPRPGDRLPLTGLEAIILSSGGETLSMPLPEAASAPNTSCVGPGVAASEVTENPRSTGVLLQFGKFRFLDVGDLSGGPLFSLACPSDRLGPVDVYLVSHHGGEDASEPSLFAAITPRVAILNNGATKGGAVATLKTLRASPGTETWQLHRSELKGAENVGDEHIANLSETTAHWIKISASADGSFTVTNARAGFTKRYPAR